jgi:hypothetical protein
VFEPAVIIRFWFVANDHISTIEMPKVTTIQAIATAQITMEAEINMLLSLWIMGYFGCSRPRAIKRNLSRWLFRMSWEKVFEIGEMT